MKLAVISAFALVLAAPVLAQEAQPAPTVSTSAGLLIGALSGGTTASIASVVTLATVATVQSTGSTK